MARLLACTLLAPDTVVCTHLPASLQGLPAVDACDGDIQLRCLPDAPPVIGDTGPAWSLGRVTDCLGTEVELDREATGAGSAAAEAFQAADAAETSAAAGAGAGAQIGRRRQAREAAAAAQRRRRQAEEPAGDAAAADAAAGSQEPAELRRTEPVLSADCRAFLDVALPVDAYEEFQGRCVVTWGGDGGVQVTRGPCMGWAVEVHALQCSCAWLAAVCAPKGQLRCGVLQGLLRHPTNPHALPCCAPCQPQHDRRGSYHPAGEH